MIAGSGLPPRQPLRPLTLNERSVKPLFGTHSAEAAVFAAKEHLSYTDLTQVLRMVEYYNQRLAK